jgi:cysteine desulfurase
VKRLYFDHNATCPMRASAREALLSCLSDPLAGNPSSVHADGRRSRQRLEEAREELAALLDCDRDELLFTSGGTESNAMSLAAAPAERPVLHGPVEHPSILAPLALRPGSVPLPVDGFGRVDPEDVTRAAASASPGLVTLALANHEVGTVQDTSAIAEAAHRADALVHCDASQAFGKWPLSFRQLDVDLMTLAAHKLGGPVGIGALVVRKDTPFSGLILGGEQESGLRPGTEPAILAAAFAAAAREAVTELPDAAPRWHGWTEQIWRSLADGEHEVVRNSPEDGRLPNTLNVSFPGRVGSSLVQRLDLEGVSASHGSACASGSVRPSPVLLALGSNEARAIGALRISVGPLNADEDVPEFLVRLARVLDAIATRTNS